MVTLCDGLGVEVGVSFAGGDELGHLLAQVKSPTVP